MSAKTRPRLTLIRKSFRMEPEQMLTPREKNPLYQRLRGGSNPRHCITQDSKRNTLPTELCRHPFIFFFFFLFFACFREGSSLDAECPCGSQCVGNPC